VGFAVVLLARLRAMGATATRGNAPIAREQDICLNEQHTLRERPNAILPSPIHEKAEISLPGFQ